MELTLKQITDAAQPLTRLGAEKLSAKLAFRLKRNIGFLNPELQAFSKEVERLRNEIYGEKQADGTMIVPPEKRAAFQEEIDEMMSEVFGLDIRTIALDELTCGISALDLDALEWMFTEEKPKL